MRVITFVFIGARHVWNGEFLSYFYSHIGFTGKVHQISSPLPTRKYINKYVQWKNPLQKFSFCVESDSYKLENLQQDDLNLNKTVKM
jgi:hypothetical protein